MPYRSRISHLLDITELIPAIGTPVVFCRVITQMKTMSDDVRRKYTYKLSYQFFPTFISAELIGFYISSNIFR